MFAQKKQQEMEQLLHYVWKHRIFPLKGLQTTDGQTVEVIDCGLPNRHAGPDFFNAKVKINGTLWVGNVEIHERASDWYAHHHNRDTAYDNVVLHVCETIDRKVTRSDGEPIPQLCLPVPESVQQNYQTLLTDDRYPPCRQTVETLPPINVHAWLNTLCVERLEQKTELITQRVTQSNGNWENAYFETLARSFGFGVNGDVFERWARQIPLIAVGRHRDNPLQVEAIFIGQAGLLDAENIPERHREETLCDPYFQQLLAEYRYLAHKLSLKPMDGASWRFLRLRPQNFPHIRLAQLTNLYCLGKASLSKLTECRTAKQMSDLLRTGVTPYWQTHYLFGRETTESTKQLSARSLQLLIINAAIPILFAYGRHLGKEEWCERAVALLDEIRAEDNHITRMWQTVRIPIKTAADSQGLVQLKNDYCDKKACLRCRFGHEHLKATARPLSTTSKGT